MKKTIYMLVFALLLLAPTAFARTKIVLLPIGGPNWSAFQTDIIPKTDNTYDLGSSSKRWAEGHVTLFLADNASIGALDVTGVTDNNIFYMSASGAADSPIDRVDATTLSVTGSDPAFTLIPSTATDTRFWFGNISDNDGVDDDKLQLGTGIVPGTDPKVTMDKDGNFGLGTASPSYPLHVIGNVLATGWIYSGTSFQCNSYYPVSTSQSMYIGTSGAKDLYLRTNDAIQLTIDPSGNVGINTTSPQGLTQWSSTDTHGGHIRDVLEATVDITAAATITLDLNIPSGWVVEGCQLHVKTALAGGETWDAELNDGGSVESIVSGAAVAQNTNVNHFCYADAGYGGTLTDAVTDIVITKNGGGAFTAQGTIEGHCMVRGFDTWDNE